MTFLIISIIIFTIAYAFYAYMLFKHNGTDSYMISLFLAETMLLAILISGCYLIGGWGKAFLPERLAVSFLLGAVLAVILAVQVLHMFKHRSDEY